MPKRRERSRRLGIIRPKTAWPKTAWHGSPTALSIA